VPRATFTFADESGQRLSQTAAAARGPFLYLVQETRCYRVDVRELV
jgi:hypothetical protein